MTRGRRYAIVALIVLGVLLGIRAGIGITHDGGDYETSAGPALDALARGDLHEFFATIPALGPLTLALRGPVVALLFHADVRVVYLAGAALCFVPVAGLGFWIARQLKTTPDVAAAALVLIVANPLTFRVIHWGHPEDFAAAAGVVGSALALLRGKPRLAGLLLGLAFASKQWALLAAPVLFVAASPQRRSFALAATVVSALLYLPLAIGNPGHLAEVMKAAANPQAFYWQPHERQDVARAAVVPGMTHVTPFNIWWPSAVPHRELVLGEALQSRLVAKPVVALGHGLALMVALLVAVVVARRGPPGRAEVLLALAVVFLVRCIVDPLDFDYHHLVFYLSLVAWETYDRKQLPVLSAAVATAFGAMFLMPSYSLADFWRHSQLFNALYLAWALPLAAVLAIRLAGRGVPGKRPVSP